MLRIEPTGLLICKTANRVLGFVDYVSRGYRFNIPPLRSMHAAVQVELLVLLQEIPVCLFCAEPVSWSFLEKRYIAGQKSVFLFCPAVERIFSFCPYLGRPKVNRESSVIISRQRKNRPLGEPI